MDSIYYDKGWRSDALPRAASILQTQLIHSHKQTQMDHPGGPSGWKEMPSQPQRDGESLVHWGEGGILQLMLSAPTQPGTDHAASERGE